MSDWKRRAFVKRVGFGLPLVAPGISRTILGANDRVSTALVGAGRRGSTVAGYFLDAGASLQYVCDVYQSNLERHLAEARKAGVGDVTGCRDFRRILDDKNVDTLLIASPDHWHPYQTIAGCKAGKDVYVEKPVAVSIDQVERMVAPRSHASPSSIPWDPTTCATSSAACVRANAQSLTSACTARRRRSAYSATSPTVPKRRWRGIRQLRLQRQTPRSSTCAYPSGRPGQPCNFRELCGESLTHAYSSAIRGARA